MAKQAKKSEPLIEVKRLKKTYWSGEVAVPAVKGVDLTIAQGEFIAIMGHSGSGKSTLMNMLAFLDAPTSGSYHFAGENITEFGDDYLSELRNATIGFVFQQFHLLPRTSALDNVRLPMRYAGVKPKEQKERAIAALEQVGLGDRLDHTPSQLSGGQQQRVSIARAIVNDPLVLFCDEPTGNLDTETSNGVMKLISGLHESGKTIIMVTHEDDMAAYAEKTINMKDGEIV